MSTITKELAKLFRKITNSEIDAEGSAHVVLFPADSLLINNARIALASMDAEPVGYFYADKPGDWYQISDGDRVPSHRRIPLYANPQSSPVVKLPNEFFSSEGIVVQIEKLMAVLAVHGIQYERRGNACRAAMLQAEPASNSDELPLDYLQGHKDGLEWAAQLAEANHPQTGDWLYDDPIELARAIRKGPDMPTVQDGKSPVAPGAWIPVSERMPNKLIPVMVMYEDGEMWSAMWNGNRWDDGTEYPDPHSVTHWRKMPAAPQQEVKLALEHGMRRYAGAMQKLSEGDD